jgi:hypothetical protein
MHLEALTGPRTDPTLARTRGKEGKTSELDDYPPRILPLVREIDEILLACRIMSSPASRRLIRGRRPPRSRWSGSRSGRRCEILYDIRRLEPTIRTQQTCEDIERL